MEYQLLHTDYSRYSEWWSFGLEYRLLHTDYFRYSEWSIGVEWSGVPTTSAILEWSIGNLE